MRAYSIRPQYVESFPKQLEEGVLYISKEFRSACHSCCCGCGTKLITPLRPTEYTLTEVGGLVSLDPSVGNWNHPCQSHYVIRNNQVEWAATMSKAAIKAGRDHDAAQKAAYFGRASKPWWKMVLEWIRSLFR